MNYMQGYGLKFKQRLIFYKEYLKVNDKLDRELFNKIFFHTRTRSEKLERYWSVIVTRADGNNIRKTGEIVGYSTQRIIGIERKVVRLIIRYEQQADSGRA